MQSYHGNCPPPHLGVWLIKRVLSLMGGLTRYKGHVNSPSKWLSSSYQVSNSLQVPTTTALHILRVKQSQLLWTHYRVHNHPLVNCRHTCVPLATISPFSLLKPEKASHSQCSGNTGTTSVWQLSITEGNSGSLPTQLIITTGRRGATCSYTGNQSCSTYL